MALENGSSGDERLGRADLKVMGGKLVSAETVVNAGYLVEVKITGDFFMHPEETIEDLEKELRGIPVGDLDRTVAEFFSRRSVELIGASSDDFVKVLKSSLGQAAP